MSHSYQAFTIELHPQPRTGASSSVQADAHAEDGRAFSLMVRVTYSYATEQQVSGSEVATELALALAHGWIDTGRYESQSHGELVADTYWNRRKREADVTDNELRLAVLRALLRMHRAQATESEVLYLDVEGLGLVLEVNPDRVRGILADLLAEGVAEPYAESFGQSATDGRCRITGTGLRELRDLGAAGLHTRSAIPGWPDLEVRLGGLKRELDRAESMDDFQDVGRRCREIIIDAANVVFRDSMVSEGQIAPGREDAKARIDLFLSERFARPSSDELRQLVRALWGFVQAVTHSDHADSQLAAVAAEGTTAMVRILQELERRSPYVGQ